MPSNVKDKFSSTNFPKEYHPLIGHILVNSHDADVMEIIETSSDYTHLKLTYGGKNS